MVYAVIKEPAKWLEEYAEDQLLWASSEFWATAIVGGDKAISTSNHNLAMTQS